MATTHVSSLTGNTTSRSNSHPGQGHSSSRALAVGDRVRIQSANSDWKGKIGRVVKFTPTGLADTIIESANPHLKSRQFSTPVLVRMSNADDDDDDKNRLIADELLAQFEWSQQQVRETNPAHVLAKHVVVYYDPRFCYNVVRAPTGMEHLSVYQNPSLPRNNALIAAGDLTANVWVPRARQQAAAAAAVLVTGPGHHHRERRAKNQAPEAEWQAGHVPAVVRVVANNSASTTTTTQAERVPSVCTGSTQFYSTLTDECPDADDASTIVTNLDRYVEAMCSQQRAVTPPPLDHQHNFPADDATTDAGLVSAVQEVADWMTARKLPITGATLEQLFRIIIEPSDH
jgi:hypothetical protein